jgi:hypothetical protein
MDITDQERAEIAAAAGLQPWEINVVPNPDGTVRVTKVAKPPGEQGAAATFGRAAVGNIPRATTAAAGAVASSKIAAPLLTKAAEFAAQRLPYGKVISPIIKYGGGLLSSVPGAMAGHAVAPAIPGVKSYEDFALGDEARRLRTTAEHPTAEALGAFAANLAPMRLPDVGALRTAIPKALTLRRLATADPGFSARESEAVMNAFGGGGMALGQGVHRQLTDDQPGMQLGPLAMETAMGFGLGSPRGIPAGVGGLVGDIGAGMVKKIPGMGGKPMGAPLANKPRTAEEILAAYGGKTTAEPELGAEPFTPADVNNLAKQRDQRRAGEVASARQAMKAGDIHAEQQGEYVRARLAADVKARAAAGEMPPEDLAPALAELAEAKAEDLAQFHDELQSLSRGDLNKQRMTGLLTGEASPAQLQANVAGWKRPVVPTEGPSPVVPVTTADVQPEMTFRPGPSTAELVSKFGAGKPTGYWQRPPQPGEGAGYRGKPKPAMDVRSDAERLQDELEGNRVKFQEAKEEDLNKIGRVAEGAVEAATGAGALKPLRGQTTAEPSGWEQQKTRQRANAGPGAYDYGDMRKFQEGTTAEPAQEREIPGLSALERRGFDYDLTPDAIPMPGGRIARGSFEPTTGRSTISTSLANETTAKHEGMHGELQDMLLSGNPRLEKLAADMVQIAGEETLAEGGAVASNAQEKSNRLYRLLADNWNWLRTTKFGGGDQSPDRLARVLAERFDFQAPGAVKTAGAVGGIVKAQPLKINSADDAEEFKHKLWVVHDSPDLLEDYNVTKEQVSALIKSIPAKGEWDVPAWAKALVKGEMQDHALVLRDIADDAKSANDLKEYRRINKQADRLEDSVAKFQEVTSPDEFTGAVPHSVLGAVPDATVRKAGYDFQAEKRDIMGKVFNLAAEDFRKLGSGAALKSMLAKKSAAFDSGKPASYTPEEAPIAARWDQMLAESHALRTAYGISGNNLADYVPHMPDVAVVRAAEKNFPDFVTQWLPRFLSYNATEFGPASAQGPFDPADAAKYFRDYFLGASRAPNSEFGAEFGVLTKGQRQYGLPPEMRQDTEALVRRFGERFTRGLVEKKYLKDNPAVAPKLGLDKSLGGVPEGEVYKNMRSGLAGQLAHQGKADPLSSAGELYDAARQSVNTLIMQAPTGLVNTVSKLKDYGVVLSKDFENSLPALSKAITRTLTEYGALRRAAIGADVIKPGQDYIGENENLATVNKVARDIRQFNTQARKFTGAEYIEQFNRVMDYALGEELAQVYLEQHRAGNPKAKEFWDRFGAGIDDTMPDATIIKRAAANFVTDIQGSYGVEGLPAWLLNNSNRALVMRLQRFGWENMRRVQKNVVEPATKGDYGPLLTYVLGSAVTAPVIMALREKLSRRPSGLPTMQEVETAGASKAVNSVLNIMEMAEAAGSFGFIGNLSGAVAKNLRGSPRAAVMDPALAFGVSGFNNVLQSIDAAREGEPVDEVIQEALKRTLVDSSQNLRPFNVDEGEAQDQRNKRVFSQLTGRKETSAAEAGMGMLVGNMFGPGRKIQPTMDKAKQGDRAAYQQLPPEKRRQADNYPGGYEGPEAERDYRTFMKNAQGPEALAAYLQRRREYQQRVRRGAGVGQQ